MSKCRRTENGRNAELSCRFAWLHLHFVVLLVTLALCGWVTFIPVVYEHRYKWTSFHLKYRLAHDRQMTSAAGNRH